jgi:hypothetical protein
MPPILMSFPAGEGHSDAGGRKCTNANRAGVSPATGTAVKLATVAAPT